MWAYSLQLWPVFLCCPVQPCVLPVLAQAEGPLFTAAPEPAHCRARAHTAALTFPGCGSWPPGSPWATYAGSLAARRPWFCRSWPAPPLPVTAHAWQRASLGAAALGRPAKAVPFCFLDCAEWACHCLYRVWPRLLQPVPPRLPQERQHLPDLQEEDEPQTLPPHLHLTRPELPRRRTDSDVPRAPHAAFVGSLPPIS